MRYNHRVDARPAVRWNQHARWAEPRVTEDQWEASNRMAWPLVLAVPVVIVGLALWALPAEAGPRWSASPSQQAVSAADAATITNARGR